LSETSRALVTQDEVTKFYDRLVFPSKTSHKAYEELVPRNLGASKVGDFGCGQSLFIDTFRQLNYDVLFLDIASNVLKHIDYGKKIHASLTDIPLANGYMDVIFCIGVLHHIPEMGKASAELARVLKKGGRLYLGVYATKTLQSFIRKAYNRTGNALLRGIIYLLTGFLIWRRHRRNKLGYGSVEHVKRIDDILKTPYVRYLPPQYYATLFEENGCIVNDTTRISSMNVLILEKTI